MYAVRLKLSRLAVVMLATVGLLGAPGAADAHANLRAAIPPEAIVGNGAIQEVRLVFSEPVVSRFSTFRLFRLNLPEEGLRNLAQLNTLASELNANPDDTVHDEVSVESDLSSQAAEVSLSTRAPLPAGAYAVIWKVLSSDGHTTTGFHTFVNVGDAKASK
ncbi:MULTISPECIES: copper resistance CopC family protein [Thioalkalivibrio]|uniref:copper resistance CopC family protein n=1 Tax=Thioalkalivibrio TaxID=106633 RepID=UPI0003779426|nr:MULTISPECIES: copper resistance CopC family protein [unclassified Thioalkalivibrio]